MLSFLNLYGVESLRGRGKSGCLHVDELVLKHCSNIGLVVDIVREVHVDCIGADVGVFGGVDPCEVLILDEEWAVRRRQRGDSERAM